MQEMLKLPLELIFLKTRSAAKSTAEERRFCPSPSLFLASPPSVFPPRIPQKPQSAAGHAHLCRSAAGGSSCAPLPAICLRPPAARPRARHCARHRATSRNTPPSRGATHSLGDGHAIAPPPPQRPCRPWRHHSSGFYWDLTHPRCFGNREPMVFAIFFGAGLSKKNAAHVQLSPTTPNPAREAQDQPSSSKTRLLFFQPSTPTTNPVLLGS